MYCSIIKQICPIRTITKVFLVSGQLPPKENCPPRLGLGFGSRLGLILGLGGNQTIAPEENYSPVRFRVWVRVSFGVGGSDFLGRNFPATKSRKNLLKHPGSPNKIKKKLKEKKKRRKRMNKEKRKKGNSKNQKKNKKEEKKKKEKNKQKKDYIYII